MRNAENIRWATLRNLEVAFRHFAVALEEGLKQTSDAIREVMRAARLRQREGKSRAQPELEGLGQASQSLTELANALRRFGADASGVGSDE